MNKSIKLFICLLFVVKIDIAQTITTFDDHFLQELANYQVKDLSQFMDRFNYKEHMVFKNDTVSNRYKNLISLFNIRDTALRRDSNVMSFIKYVCDEHNNIKISFKDTNWYAIAHCIFLYHSKEKTVNIILKPEMTSNNGYYWAIVGVQSDLFTPEKKGKTFSAFINPMNHEVNFSELSKALLKRKDVYEYTSASYKPDPTSAFFAYVKNGDLQFRQIKSIDFDFLQVTGWFFSVKEFFRIDLNSGWLIFLLQKMNAQEKEKFVKNISLNNSRL